MTAVLHAGVLVVDKPPGPTSFAIVAQVRRSLGLRKVGHGGTLDPLASGVLPICLGEGTKLAPFLLAGDKEYEATVRFGVATDTYDVTGQVIAETSTEGLTRTAVEKALEAFIGEQQQTPPIYSALKHAGRPLYAYARAGESVPPPSPRRIEIKRLELLAFDAPNEARVRIACSKGTYVRSLAHDLGAALGIGAHLTALRRTRSGPFTLDEAIPPSRLGADALPVIGLADALRHLRAVTVSDAVARALCQGQSVPWERVTTALPPGSGPVRLLTDSAQLIAVADPGEGAERVRTLRVFTAGANPGLRSGGVSSGESAADERIARSGV